MWLTCNAAGAFQSAPNPQQPLNSPDPSCPGQLQLAYACTKLLQHSMLKNGTTQGGISWLICPSLRKRPWLLGPLNPSILLAMFPCTCRRLCALTFWVGYLPAMCPEILACSVAQSFALIFSHPKGGGALAYAEKASTYG